MGDLLFASGIGAMVTYGGLCCICTGIFYLFIFFTDDLALCSWFID